MWNWVKGFWERCGSDPEYLAQIAHILVGSTVTLILALHLKVWAAAGLTVALAVGKELSEFITETAETRGSTLKDIAFWCVGIVVALFFLR